MLPESIQYEAIIQRLVAGNVRFVVIGGVAMSLHGADNVTFDMDISFARDRTNTEALASFLSSVGAVHRGLPEGVRVTIDGKMLRNSTNLTLRTTLGDFDLLAEPAGVDSFDGLHERATVMEIGGISVHVASIDDLISMKRAANRPKDQLHVMTLEALRRLRPAAP